MAERITAKLFRPEAIVHQRHQGEGHPRLIMPPGSGLLSLGLLLVVVTGLVYLWMSHYTRKATVAGYVQTSSMTKRLYSPVTGSVSVMRVSVGQAVKRGQQIATIEAASSLSNTDRRQMLAGFDKQVIDTDKRIKSLQTEQQARQDDFRSRTVSARKSLEHARKIKVIQAQKVAQLRKTRDLAQPLFQAGELSRLEWARFSGSLLDGEELLERLSNDAGAKHDQIDQLKMSLRKSAIDTHRQIVELQQEMSRIEQSRRSLAAKAQATIRASIDGTIANIFVQPGDTISTSRPVVSITPRGTRFVAKLLVPSSAVGFISKGQRVNLLYDAFPYEEFGVFPARLISISRHAMAPGDSTISLPGRQPFFEAIAAIDKPWVIAHGRKIPLRAGMSLQADVLLDHQSLLQWLIDPLYAASERAR